VTDIWCQEKLIITKIIIWMKDKEKVSFLKTDKTRDNNSDQKINNETESLSNDQ